MRTDEFKQRLLTTVAALPSQPTCLLEGDVIVTFKDLPKEGIKYSRVHLRRLIARGLFPPPIMLSPNRQGWGRRTHIEPWKASRPIAPIKRDLDASTEPA
jgi:predicted DNA-binding transcriptional regulator AlpA